MHYNRALIIGISKCLLLIKFKIISIAMHILSIIMANQFLIDKGYSLIIFKTLSLIFLLKILIL